jgi:hypothetical protein
MCNLKQSQGVVALNGSGRGLRQIIVTTSVATELGLQAMAISSYRACGLTALRRKTVA